MGAFTLEVSGLVTEVETGSGRLRAVDGVSFTIAPGSALALVGESGCGKTLTALSLLQVLPPRARLAAGSVRLCGEELVGAAASRLQALRGNRLAMIFQEPMTALNPLFTVGEQVAEVLRTHQRLGRAAAASRAVELLAAEGLEAPERQAGQYPHQLSGGMRQRVLIAMALACEPALLIADEPTSALDVGLQAKLLERLHGLRRARGMALLWVTHDLARVRQHADAVAVMYAGRIVERGSAAQVLTLPRHPYTQGLVQCLVRPAPRSSGARRARLPTIAGGVASSSAWQRGCAFRARCGRASERCATQTPELEGSPRAVACHHPVDAEAPRVQA